MADLTWTNTWLAILAVIAAIQFLIMCAAGFLAWLATSAPQPASLLALMGVTAAGMLQVHSVWMARTLRMKISS